MINVIDYNRVGVISGRLPGKSLKWIENYVK